MDIFLVWNLPSFKCWQQIQNVYLTFSQTNQVCRLDLAVDHLLQAVVLNLVSQFLFVRSVSPVYCPLPYKKTAWWPQSTATSSWILCPLTKQTLSKVVPLVWSLFLGFTILFTRVIWFTPKFVLYAMDVRIRKVNSLGLLFKCSLLKRDVTWGKKLYFLFLPSLIFPSLWPIVTSVWSVF